MWGSDGLTHKLLPFFSPSSFIPLFLPAKPSSEVEMERLRGHRESWNHPSIHPSAMRRGIQPLQRKEGFFSLFSSLLFLFILFFSKALQAGSRWSESLQRASGHVWKEPAGVPKIIFYRFFYDYLFIFLLFLPETKRESGAELYLAAVVFSSNRIIPAHHQSHCSQDAVGKLFWRKYDCKDTNKGKEDWIKNVYFFTYI